MLPSLFVSHGAPTLPFDDCPAREFLRGLGAHVGKPKAIVIATAHWDTASPLLNRVAVNDTIHDFSGFPETLYALRYAAPGSRALSDRAAGLLGDAGMQSRFDDQRGLDHGAWVPLMLMYPGAGIPVVQLSIQSAQGAARHIALGRALTRLREDDVLIIGSGSFTHNLRLLDRAGHGAPEPEWCRAFAAWTDEKLLAGDEAALADYRMLAPFADIAQPSDEHFVPLHFALGAGGKGARATRLHSSATFGSLRMDAYAFS